VTLVEKITTIAVTSTVFFLNNLHLGFGICISISNFFVGYRDAQCTHSPCPRSRSSTGSSWKPFHSREEEEEETVLPLPNLRGIGWKKWNRNSPRCSHIRAWTVLFPLSEAFCYLPTSAHTFSN